MLLRCLLLLMTKLSYWMQEVSIERIIPIVRWKNGQKDGIPHEYKSPKD